ncbi:uncharacterized protein SETTUDRAFT_152366 [Exserohilum turcica Et28A]|uniref:Uncharacterized protein n=1 Tax=Exserohilum turcicum (strain 28A) TaxID=671987 RepID=R0KED8_EXST2|nr:uncharacterized protein SETTUDRAFT_152366 [Exserohilum turcica Et28A]EOA91223.1 hypothetical protein SETTUDRAFT_152366 [Exserohilum turcica Et28A]
MRYDNWDVILFPKDSHVPIQEFKTACYVSSEEYGRQLPTLTCYINSLPPSTPFRISVHSWGDASKASALIESQRKGNQKTVFAVQVIIDGARVFRGFFDLASKWPQEISHEKRSLTFNEPPSTHRKQCLEFPPFHKHTLMQNLWDSRDLHGRIRVVLSEQLISKTSSPGDLDLDVLEQAGISWPIRNPLYLPNAFNRDKQHPQTSPATSWTPNTRTFAGDNHAQTPPSPRAQPIFAKSHENEPKRRSNAHLPPISQFSRHPMVSMNNSRAGMWDDAFGMLGNGADDMNTDNWATKRGTPGSCDYSMPDYMYTSHHSTNGSPWMENMTRFGQSESTGWNDRPRKEKEKQVIVTLREDQLGQIIEAISPPKRHREIPRAFDAQYHENDSHSHSYHQAKYGAAPLTSRPSSASLGRKWMHPDSNSALRNSTNKVSFQKNYGQDEGKDRMPMTQRSSTLIHKENNVASQLRLPTPFPYANRVPTPNPFVQRQSTAASEMSMRDPSSIQPTMYRFSRSEAPPPTTEPSKFGSAHGPSTVNVRSRKEGLASDSPKLTDKATRHDQSLLPTVSPDAGLAQSSTCKDQSRFTHGKKGIPDLVEIIDVDAIDPSLDSNMAMDNTKLSPFKSSHKSGASVSSIDSTVRLERQLFSALGEELGSFDHHHRIDTTGMGPELAQALGGGTVGAGGNPHSEVSASTTTLNPAASDFEPSIKRKRQGTLGGERDASPMSIITIMVFGRVCFSSTW